MVLGEPRPRSNERLEFLGDAVLGWVTADLAFRTFPDMTEGELTGLRKGFGDISVELDAIEPNQLRQLVQDAIEQHLPADQFEVLKAAEESEREIISRLVHTATKRRAKGGAR